MCFSSFNQKDIDLSALNNTELIDKMFDRFLRLEFHDLITNPIMYIMYFYSAGENAKGPAQMDYY